MNLPLVDKFKNSQALSRLHNCDKETFVAVYDANVKDIYRFVYFKVGNREEADDLTSMIFLKAWNHVQEKTLEDANTLRALLYKIARNVIIDYYRENNNKQKLSLDDENNPLDLRDEAPSPAELFDNKNDYELIRRQLPLLKEEYREIIIMRFVSDLSIEEIADITGKKKGNIRVLLHRALNALRELIEKEDASKAGL